MADDVQANVVLTADNTQYDQAMSSSATTTEGLGAAVDSVTQKLDRIAKSAGKKMVGVGVFDVAGVSAAAVAYGNFEKQMETLAAQSVTLTRSMGDAKRVYSEYEQQVNKLRGSFGMATSEAAALVQQVSKISDNTTSVSKLTDTFVRLGAATGESSNALAGSMNQLQKLMGTPNRETEKLSSQLLTLQANTNTSAKAILDFGTQIAPVGRQLGISQQDIQAFSSGFAKAGQDGYRSASVFNKVLSDISTATATGSPELKKYSNLVGMTVGQFKELGGTQKFLSVIEAINRQGPRAIAQLNQMGLDGVSTVRTITGLAQSGGLQKELDKAANADPSTLQQSSQAAMDGLFDSFKKLRQEVQMTGETIGKNFAGPMAVIVKSFTAVTSVVNDFLGSGAGKLLTWVGATAGGFIALGGAILIAAKGLAAFSLANLALRNSFTAGFRDAAKENTVAGRQGLIGSNFGLLPGQTPVGSRGRAMQDSGRANVTNQGLYRAGARLGMSAPGFMYGDPGDPSRLRGLASAGGGYGLSAAGWIARNVIGAQYSPGTIGIDRLSGMPGYVEGTGGLNNPALRSQMIKSQTVGGMFGWAGRFGEAFREGGTNAYQRLTSYQAPATTPGVIRGVPMGTPGPIQGAGPMMSNAQIRAAIGGSALPPTGAAAVKQAITTQAAMPPVTQGLTDRLKGLASNFKTLESSSMTLNRGFMNLGRGMGSMMVSMGAAGGGAIATGASWMKGGAAALAGNPVTLALSGYMAYEMLKNRTKVDTKEYGGTLDPYLQAGGISPPAAGGGSKTPPPPKNVKGAMNISKLDTAWAERKNYQPAGSALQDLSKEEAISALSSQWALMERNPQAIQALKTDLIAEFGAPGASEVLTRLKSGATSQLSFGERLEDSFEVRRRKLGLQGEDKKAITKPLKKVLDIAGDRSDLAYQYGGSEAMFAQKGRDTNAILGSLYQGYQGAETKKPNLLEALIYGPGGAQHGSMGESAIGTMGAKDSETKISALAETLRKESDLGKSFGKGDMQVAMQAMASAKDANDAMKKFWIEYFKGGGITQDDQLALLASRGIDERKAAGMSAAERAAAISGIGMAGRPLTKALEDPDSLDSRISRLPGVRGAWNDKGLQKALLETGNVNLQMQEAQDLMRRLGKGGKSDAQVIKTLGDIQAESGVETAPQYQIAQTAQQFAERKSAFRIADMNRTDAFAAKADIFTSKMQVQPGDPKAQEKQQAAIESFFADTQEQKQFFTQLLYQQREYEVMRTRAEEDYNLMRKYAQEDYNLMRERAEMHYQRQRDRAEQSFARSQRQARQDYNISRRQQEQDHHHQVMVMVEQQAKAMYNIYERVKVERTNSSTWLLSNAQDQLKRMEEQSTNLDKLRKMGMKDDTIQQLGLTDPNNAQQLSRMVSEIADNPRLVRQFNRQVSKRLKAAKDLVTDSSSADWEEFERSFRLSRNRAEEGFERQMRRARRNFKISMAQMDEDYKTTMAEQAENHETAMGRQQRQHRRVMNQAAEDLERHAKTIDGNLESILTKSVNKLTGHAKTQAQAVLDEFKDLKKNSTGQSIQTMELISDVFGFNWEAPAAATRAANRSNPASPRSISPANRAAGGVLPGYTPGVDVHHFKSDTAGELNLSGGEAIMVPEWTQKMGGAGAVNEMNRRARGEAVGHHFAGQGFASGGTYKNPSRRVSMDGEPLTAITAAQILLAEKLSNKNIHVMQGSFQPHTSYSGSSHMGAGVADTGPGNFSMQYWLRRVGFAAWGRNFPGAASAGSGAHIHSVSRLDPGARGHAQLSSFARGEDGLGGRDYGPNPSVLPGIMTLLNQFGHLALSMGGGGGGPAMINPKSQALDLLKDSYPKIENQVARMVGIHLPPDTISGIINKFAKQRIEKMADRWDNQHPGGMIAGFVGGAGGGAGSSSSNNSAQNRALGRTLAARRGWRARNWTALDALWQGESGWDHQANNPSSSAYGIPQGLVDLHNIPKPYWESKTGSGKYSQYRGGDPAYQINWGLNYIAGKFGNPQVANAYKKRNGSYGEGAIFEGANNITVGERGAEAVIPLNNQGADFLVGLMTKLSGGLEAKQHNVRGSAPVGNQAVTHTTYQIDRSTTFSGNITVAANNPNELIHNLQARQRVRALSQPVLAGR